MVSRLECPICFYEFNDFGRLPQVLDKCGHTFCYGCLSAYLESQTDRICPLCRASIDANDNLPTDETLLELWRMKKMNPKCSCEESRTHWCPTCFKQKYVDWDEMRESGENTFCLGCARNHFHDMEHKCKEVSTNQDSMSISFMSDVTLGVEAPKKGINYRKVAIGVGAVAIGGLSIALTVSLCILFKEFTL